MLGSFKGLLKGFYVRATTSLGFKGRNNENRALGFLFVGSLKGSVRATTSLGFRGLNN